MTKRKESKTLLEEKKILTIFKGEFGQQITTSNKFRIQGVQWLIKFINNN